MLTRIPGGWAALGDSPLTCYGRVPLRLTKALGNEEGLSSVEKALKKLGVGAVKG